MAASTNVTICSVACLEVFQLHKCLLVLVFFYLQVLSSFKCVAEQLEVLVRGGVRGVVVEGPEGCGKTALLRGLAARHGRRPGERLLYLHLGEQVDGKVTVTGLDGCTSFLCLAGHESQSGGLGIHFFFFILYHIM